MIVYTLAHRRRRRCRRRDVLNVSIFFFFFFFFIFPFSPESLTLFFVLIGFVCLFVVMPEIKSMSMSADIMANSSIPMAESAMHVENIAERYWY